MNFTYYMKMHRDWKNVIFKDNSTMDVGNNSQILNIDNQCVVCVQPMCCVQTCLVRHTSLQVHCVHMEFCSTQHKSVVLLHTCVRCSTKYVRNETYCTCVH
ncbi:hypothetical protein NP493_1036g00010 [Ridgeia piscesae]|uniref:Uncharacterized protein n=1 Tax=Ridgeia piscesae TaxID=27915 RepID=A0AAD9KJ68_RIDPI|nr:hypothetical protein NP493_1036g00010 [Ridgeia piscesae]